MIYNGNDLSQYMIVASPTRSILPEVEVSYDDVPGMDGGQYVSRRLLPRTIDVRVLLRKSAFGRSESARILAPLLLADGPAPLVLDDEPGRYYMAILSGATDLDSLWRAGGGTISFLCPDPVAFSCSPRTYSVSRNAQKLYLGGTYGSWPVIRAVPASGASYYRVTDYGTGKYLQVDASFDGGKVLTIDMAGKHCDIDGANADRYVTLESDYFKMVPGENDLRFSSGSAEVEVADRWL